MLVVPICASHVNEANEKIQQALIYPVDMFELRLDYLSEITVNDIKLLMESVNLPFIFTLRKQSQAGLFSDAEEKRLTLIEQLLLLEPAYVDLEHDVDDSFFQTVSQKFTKTKIICSYHDFKKTPEDLSDILNNMQHAGVAIYKIATHAESTLDAMRLLQFAEQHVDTESLSVLGMGEYGVMTRVLAPVVKSQLNYVVINDGDQNAPGQLTLDALLNLYRYKKLNEHTKIYALLGGIVTHSRSHQYHNDAFDEKGKNAVYVKLSLTKEELPEFVKLAKQLPFYGFSVTMPLKEAIVPLLDKLDDAAAGMKSVNTIVRRGDDFVGFNTDCLGALNAIEKQIKVKDKKMIVLGAGGTARAIAYEAIRRGADVIVLNRTVERAEALAVEFGCQAFGLDAMPRLRQEGYDILANATSVGMGDDGRCPISPEDLLPRCVVLDMVHYPLVTPLLKLAEEKGCRCVTGDEAFVEQAIAQQRIFSS